MRNLKVIMFLVLFAVSSLAVAKSVTLSWEAPTTRENGAVLTLEEIAGFEVLINELEIIKLKSNQTVYSYTIEPGNEYTFRVRTQDTDGLYSDYSGTLSIELSRPSPVTIELTLELEQ